MIELSQIEILQDGFRLSEDLIHEMIRFVAGGGRFNEKALRSNNPERTSLIAITQFEDGVRYIRDGFHRAAVIEFAREQAVLFDDEYVVEYMTYDMYLQPNLVAGWCTPFDPRSEVRKPDFFEFKSMLAKYESHEDIARFIAENRGLYCIPRTEEHKLSRFVRELGSYEEVCTSYHS